MFVLKQKSVIIIVVATSIRRALALFYSDGELTARELQRLLDVSTKTTYDVIDYLMRKHLITRVARGQYRITKKGEKIAEALMEL